MRIILGSSSVRRAEIMRRVVPEFDIIAPNIDENVFPRTSAHSVTIKVACAKAEAIAAMLSEPALIFTADTVVQMMDGSIREKPSSENEARVWLRSYRRFVPECVTAMYALRVDGHGGASKDYSALVVDTASIAFTPFSPQRIDEIIADGTAMGWSGAFTMEHPLFSDHILDVAGDPETIQGLPSRFLHLTLHLLKD